MAASLGYVLAQMQGWTAPALRELSDASLLERFVQGRDESAFAALVSRHGAMVLRSCRRILGDAHAAEDAFQATFLILARKAHTLRQPGALPGFLHSVARRAALKARTKAAVRTRQTQLLDELPTSYPDPLAQLTARELLDLLDEEIGRLPSAQRSAVILCCLEGHPCEEAACLLGWTPSAVKGHLQRGRRRLQDRLARRGIALSAALAVVAVSRSEAVPALLLRSTVTAAMHGGIRCSAAALAQSILKTMAASKLAGAMMGVLTLILAASAVALVYGGRAEETAGVKPPAAAAPPKEAKADKPQPKTDALGDPLPQGAVARLGSLRLYHGERTYRVTVSPNGKWVVSSASDGNRLWDAATGRELPLRPEFRKAAIFASNGKLLAIEQANFNLQLCDVATGKKIGGLLPANKLGQLTSEIHRGFPEGYSYLTLAPDGRTLVISNIGDVGAGMQPVLRFCDAVKGTVEEPVALEGNGNWTPTRMVFSADSKTLVMQCDNATLHVWDVARRSEKMKSQPRPNDYGGQIALSPDGKILATAPSAGKRVRLWDANTLKELPPLLKQTDEIPAALSFSTDGKQLAVSYTTGPTVRLWDLASRKEVRQFQGKAYQIFHTVFSADGKYLVAGDGEGVTFWDAETGKFRHDFGHTYWPSALRFSPDGTTLVSAAYYTDNNLRIWNPLTGEQKARLRGFFQGVDAVEYLPDGKSIVSAGEDGTVRLWDAATGREMRRLEPKDGIVYAMAVSPDGKMIASGGNKTIQLWDATTGRRLRSLSKPGSHVLCLAFSPDGKVLVSCAKKDQGVRFWDASKGELIRQVAIPAIRLKYLRFRPDGNVLAVGDTDGTVRTYDLRSGEELHRLSVNIEDRNGAKAAYALAFSPDGRTLAVGYQDRKVRLWELCSGRERACFEGHRGEIRSLTFSPDGALLASGGTDRIIMVWDVTGQRTTHPALKDRLRPEQAHALWNTLADADAHQAYAAMQSLFATGEQAMSLLRQRLRPAAAIDARRIDRLIADLDSAQFEFREKAGRELRQLGDDAEPALRKVLAGKPTAEQRLRVKQLLQDIDAVDRPERLRNLRAVEVLERLGSADARQVLQTLAAGAEGATLTVEAKAALQRLTKRR